MSAQRRHEAPELGDAIVRMMRGLVTRAAEGDTEALEQLARVEQLAPIATSMGLREGHGFGHSYTELGAALGVSRQAARQRVLNTLPTEAWSFTDTPDAHQLVPGHTKRGCDQCQRPAAVVGF